MNTISYFIIGDKMNKYYIFNNLIEKFINEYNVDGIILVGKTKEATFEDFEGLNDIDLFIVNDTKVFQREIIEIESVLFDISYVSYEILKTIIEEKIPIMVNILWNSKIVYSKNQYIYDLISKFNDFFVPSLLYHSLICDFFKLFISNHSLNVCDSIALNI